MKLRIQGNTIRIRLNEKEVDRLKSGESIEDQTVFPSARLEYRIAGGAKNSVDLFENVITITVNSKELVNWGNIEQVTIRFEVSTGDEKKISILVEKDMKL